MTTAAIIAAVCILVAGLFAVIVERTNERDEARENEARANRRADAVEAERDIANGLIERLRADRRERSNVIPFQRDGSDLRALDAEATAYTWPAIARDAFPIQQWGEDA